MDLTFPERAITPRKDSSGKTLTFEQMLDIKLREYSSVLPPVTTLSPLSKENTAFESCFNAQEEEELAHHATIPSIDCIYNQSVTADPDMSIMSDTEARLPDPLKSDRQRYELERTLHKKRMANAMARFERLEIQEESSDPVEEDPEHFDLAGYDYSLVDSSLMVDEDAEAAVKHETIAQPSKLVAAFFPAATAKRIPSSDDSEQSPVTTSPQAQQDETTPVPNLDKQRKELELEMLKYKEMNAQLKKLREDNEMKQRRLQSDRQEFENAKAVEMKSLRKKFEDEMRGLDSHARQVTKQQALNHLLPTKAERLQIDSLKNRIVKLEEDLRAKEARHKLAMERMKERVDEVTKRKDELQAELNRVESERLKLSDRAKQVAANEPPVPVKIVRFDKSIGTGKKHNISGKPKLQTQESYADGRVEHCYSNGTKVIKYSNGSVLERKPDGSTQVIYANGDKKMQFADGTNHYYFADTGMKQVTHTDGTIEYTFKDGQVEKRLKDGTREINYTDGTVRLFLANGDEECIFADGTICRIDSNGNKVIEFANGAREVYWDTIKQRFEVDGTVRTVYADGTKESKYPDGTVKRICT